MEQSKQFWRDIFIEQSWTQTHYDLNVAIERPMVIIALSYVRICTRTKLKRLHTVSKTLRTCPRNKDRRTK